MTRNPPQPSTITAQGLGWTDAETGAVVLPMYTATTFLRDPDNQYRRGRSYGRADNPSYDQLQAVLTALEGGAASLLFSSGMATAVLSSSASHETATSFGGVESLIEYRASIEGVDSPIPADLLRLTVGIEDPGYLAADLEWALRT